MTLYEPVSRVATPTRHAALLLHAMPPADRTWALEQLPPAQRAQLAALVEELQLLGIPRDPGLVDQAVNSMANPLSAQQAQDSDARSGDLLPSVRQLLAQLDSDGCRELAVLLRNEPPVLVARLLARGPWPWENELLAQLGPVKRRQLEKFRASFDSGHGANAMVNAVIETVGEHLRAVLQQRPQRQATVARVSAGRRPRWPRNLMSAFRQTGKSA